VTTSWFLILQVYNIYFSAPQIFTPGGSSSYSGKRIKFNSLKPTLLSNSGKGSSVGIATGYELDGPRIECRWGEIFRTCPDRLWGPPSLMYNGYRVFPGDKERPGRDADPSPASSAVIKKSRWAVQPARSLNTCTRVHLTFFLASNCCS